jgi:hypothetical protein
MVYEIMEEKNIFRRLCLDYLYLIWKFKVKELTTLLVVRLVLVSQPKLSLKYSGVEDTKIRRVGFWQTLSITSEVS